MSESENDKLLAESFLLGYRVAVQALRDKTAPEETPAVWVLLREVAEGKTTLIGTPAETMMKQPAARDNADLLARITSDTIRDDARLAKRLLAVLRNP